MGDHVRIGTSGWHYPTGPGHVERHFLSRDAGPPRGFDELRFYAAISTPSR